MLLGDADHNHSLPSLRVHADTDRSEQDHAGPVDADDARRSSPESLAELRRFTPFISKTSAKRHSRQVR